MCGILGKIYKYSTEINQDRFEEALHLMSHRGPDAFGTYFSDKLAFGHRRLSIIDLSESGKQPMLSTDQKVILNFNGEIYNYQELKKGLADKGYKFRGTGDSEVLLYLFYEKGIDCIQDLVGMFAFSIHDTRTDTTYIVRDRLGIKPLYYSVHDEQVTFASEIKSILKLEDRKFQPNEAVISSYLSFRYPILHDTFFEGIHSLAPAHYLKIKDGNIVTTEYWNAAHKFAEQKEDKGEAYYIEQIKSMMSSAVNYRMIADVKVGSFLSGGVDSSAVAALMTKNTNNKVSTFTIGFEEEGYNEFEYAKIVAEQYETAHHEITLSGEEYLTTMEQLIEYKDAPLSVPNEVPLYLMCKELKKHITVVLSGEGADEIFGGYGRIFRSPYDLFRWQEQASYFENKKERNAFLENFDQQYKGKHYENELNHFYEKYCYTTETEKEELLHPRLVNADYENKLKAKFSNVFSEIEADNYTNKIMYAFERVHILGLLHRVDMTTMANSVEARVPFVDHRLVELAYSIPLKYKLKWNSEKDEQEARTLTSDKISEVHDTPKYILKKSFEDILPDSILYRKKMGFPVPLQKWFGGTFNQYAKEILLDQRTIDRQQFNTKNIEQWLNEERLKTDHGFAMKIWMLINIELFNRKYFD